MNTLLFTKKKKDVICQFQSLHIPMLNIGIQFLLKWYRNLIFWELLVILRHRKSKNVSLFRKIRGLSKTMSNICDGVFCKNFLRLKTFSAKIFILYVWQGPKKVSDYPTKKNSSTAWSVHIWSFSGPHFPAIGLNMERYSVSLCIQSHCEKIRTRKTPNTETFHAAIIIR